MMAADAIRELIDQIEAVGDAKEIDILVHSTGGDALAAWKLMSLLRKRFTHVGVLVPFMAFSAATLFALGGDEIVMHPHASRGPIDPQISISQGDGKTMRQFAYEDVGAFLRFLGDEVKVTEQAYVSAVVEKPFSVVDPVHVGAAKRASELSSSVGERLLLMHMTELEDAPRAKQIAENLNKSFFAHGDAVSRKSAKDLQLKIADDNPALERLIWQAYLGLESYLQLRQPFVALQHYLADPAGAAAVQPARSGGPASQHAATSLATSVAGGNSTSYAGTKRPSYSDIYRTTPYEFVVTAEPRQISVTYGRQIQPGSSTVKAPVAPAPSPNQTAELPSLPFSL